MLMYKYIIIYIYYIYIYFVNKTSCRGDIFCDLSLDVFLRQKGKAKVTW